MTTTLTNVGWKEVLPAQAASSTATGSAVDMQGYAHGRRRLKGIVVCLPTGADANETCDVKLQESDTTTSGDFADITGATFTQILQPGGAKSEEISFTLKKRYIRAIATLAGTTPTFTLGVGVLAPKSQTP